MKVVSQAMEIVKNFRMRAELSIICQVVPTMLNLSAYIAEYVIMVSIISLQDLSANVMRCLKQLLFCPLRCHWSLFPCNSSLSLCYIIVHMKPTVQDSSILPIIPDYPPPALPQNTVNPNPNLSSGRRHPRFRLPHNNPHASSISQSGDEFPSAMFPE